MSRLPRALARLILSALLACLPASFAARAQGADEFDQAYQAELRTESDALRARVARLSPAVQAQNKQVAQAILAGDWPVAERLGADMARWIRPMPTSATSRAGCWRCRSAMRRPSKFDEAIALDAGNRWFLVSKAGAQADAGDLAGALRSAQTLCERFPDWSIGHNLRAALLDGLDRAPEALAAYERAIAANPPARRYGSTRACCCAGWAAWPTHATRSTPRCGCNRTMRGRKPSWTACPRASVVGSAPGKHSQLRPAAAPSQAQHETPDIVGDGHHGQQHQHDRQRQGSNRSPHGRTHRRRPRRQRRTSSPCRTAPAAARSARTGTRSSLWPAAFQ